MDDRATPEQLLEAARVLCEELTQAMPPDKVHLAFMLETALAIAMRQLRRPPVDREREEHAALRRLVMHGDAPLPADAADLARAIADGERTLCRWIREGRADSGDLHARVWLHLRDVSKHEVAESNPDYLATP
jgi:hypothetical protein